MFMGKNSEGFFLPGNWEHKLTVHFNDVFFSSVHIKEYNNVTSSLKINLKYEFFYFYFLRQSLCPRLASHSLRRRG